MLTRQYRKRPDGAISRSVSLPSALAEKVTEEATKEGHNNFSTVVVKALTEHFDRSEDQPAEPEQEVA